MEKLELNKNIGTFLNAQGYQLSEIKEYVINLKNELPTQLAIQKSVQLMGLEAINDWWEWLENNGFSKDLPNPTNNFVEQFYGKKTLWSTNLSQGLVVKDEVKDVYYIIMECSRENEGFKYTKIILTLGGCL